MSRTKTLKMMILSDGTGETARAIARAAGLQFPNLEVITTVHGNIRDIGQAESSIKEITIHHQVVMYTIVNSHIRNYITKRLVDEKIPHFDLMGPVLDIFAQTAQIIPQVDPGAARRVDQHYLKKMSALEFTLHAEKEITPYQLEQADLIIVGISRTSKTPLAVYLALQGLKVVNITLSPGEKPIPELFLTNQKKIYALTIHAQQLAIVRKNRIAESHNESFPDSYTDEKSIKDEIQWAQDFFSKNIRWPVIDISDRTIEETAIEILKYYEMRQNSEKKKSLRFS